MESESREMNVTEAVEQVLNMFGEQLAEVPNALVGDWVVVANYQSMENDRNRIVMFGSEHLLLHSRSGLLHEALYGFSGSNFSNLE